MVQQNIYPKYRWFVLVMLVLSTLSQGAVLIGFAPIVGEISESTGLSLGQVTGGIMGVFQFSVAIFAIIGGILLDKIGIAKTFIISNILMFVSTFLVMFVGNNFTLLIILRVLQGLGAGPIMASTGLIAVSWFPPKERGTIMGSSGASLMIGMTAGLLIVPAVFRATGSWHTPFGYVAIVSALGLIASIIYAVGPKPPKFGGVEVCDDKTIGHSFALSVKQPAFFALVLGMALCFWGMQAFNDLTPGYIAVAPPIGLGMGPMAAGKFMAVVQIGALISSLVIGTMASRVLAKHIKTGIVVCFALMGIFMYSVRFSEIFSNEGVLIVWMFFTGVFTSAIAPLSGVYTTSHFPENVQGRLSGIMMGLGILGSVLGVVAGSTFLHITGKYFISITICGIVGILGAIVTLLLLKTPKVFCLKDGKVQIDMAALK